jgi:2-keto-4-pentenoate hydratase/2-oxohepta-3-ene-1,7-dioic acid hydratase in catechol pathway
MRWASFQTPDGSSFGYLLGDGVVDVGAHHSGVGSLRDAIALGVLSELAERDGPRLAVNELKLLPPIVDPQKILCVGLNYRRHAQEMGVELPAEPAFFARFANTLVGSGNAVVKPRISSGFDYEGELAVIIGRAVQNLKPDEALSAVAGYACFGDYTARDQMAGLSGVMVGKNFPRSGAFGPVMVTADEVGCPAALTLTTRLNGTVMQASSTADLIFDVPHLISYFSRFMELSPGDVIATGTPTGVGAKQHPPVWLAAGDLVEVEVSSVGTLSTIVVDEASETEI